MKFSSKSEFQDATQEEWNRFWKTVNDYMFAGDDLRTEQELRQVLAHLYCWHRLLIGWCRAGKSGSTELPARGYNWQQTRELNRKLDREFAHLALPSVRRRLKLSHGRVMNIVASLNEYQFSQPGHFDWTGKNPISTYIVPNTFSHYRWAIKKIRMFARQKTRPET